MKNIKDYLQKSTEFQGFAIERATQLFYARGYKDYYAFRGIEFENDEVTVEFLEDARYEPGVEFITLSIELLEKTDSEWKEYIQQVTEETITKEKNEKERLEKQKLETKEREFDRLKKELGY